MPTKQEQTISSHTLAKAISIDGQIVVFQLVSIGAIEDPQLEYTLFSARAHHRRNGKYRSRTNDILPELEG